MLIHTATNEEDLKTLRIDFPLMRKVGEIVVKLHRRNKSRFIGPKMQQRVCLNEAPPTVHEKALKGEAKSHGIA